MKTLNPNVSENWVVYSYYNEKARRTELCSLEMYEGKTQKNATVFSSVDNTVSPLIERQSYILPVSDITALKETNTEKGFVVTLIYRILRVQPMFLVINTAHLVFNLPPNNPRNHEQTAAGRHQPGSRPRAAAALRRPPSSRPQHPAVSEGAGTDAVHSGTAAAHRVHAQLQQVASRHQGCLLYTSPSPRDS